jgi:hypothetical protein
MYGLLLFIAMGFVAPHLSWPFIIIWLILALFDGESGRRRNIFAPDPRPRTYFGPTWESRLSDWIIAKTRASWLLNIGMAVVLGIAVISVTAGHI